MSEGDRYAKYMYWMMHRVRAPIEYHRLFVLLHSVMFSWTIPEDEYRESDGRHIRNLYFEQTGQEFSEHAAFVPASFLEVTIALSETMEDSLLHDPESGNDSATWFWLLLRNIGLDHCSNLWCEEMDQCGMSATAHIMHQVNKVMNRVYAPDGTGGFFPCPGIELDMREMELWRQMNVYVMFQGWI